MARGQLTRTAEAVLAATRGDVRVMVGHSDQYPESERADLRRYVNDGGSLVVVPVGEDPWQSNLTGVAIAAELPRAEWIVNVCSRPEAARLAAEVPFTSPFRELLAMAGDVEVVATCSVGWKQCPALTLRPVGRGKVLCVGFTDVEALLLHPVLGRYCDRLLGRGFEVGSVRSLGLAVVGYGPFGGMGYLHGLAASETAGLDFVAAVDASTPRLVVAAQEFPGVRTYLDSAKLAGDDAVDIAVVATPPSQHAELAVALLDAGKHVVVEKPMCFTVAEADRMLAAAAANDRVLTVHQSRRWDPDYLALRRAVEGGQLGEVFNVETFVGGFEHPCRAWHSEESVSGGAVYDWGSHHIDWILRLYGSAPSRLVVTSHKRVWHDVTNADQITVAMHWNDGREGTFRQSDLAALRRPKFYVQGTKGTLEGHYRPVGFESVEPGRGYRQRHSHHAEAPVSLRMVTHEGGYGLIDQHLPLLMDEEWGFHRNLADHLLLGEALAVPGEQARAVVAVLEAAQRAGNNGYCVLDLDGGS